MKYMFSLWLLPVAWRVALVIFPFKRWDSFVFPGPRNSLSIGSSLSSLYGHWLLWPLNRYQAWTRKSCCQHLLQMTRSLHGWSWLHPSCSSCQRSHLYPLHWQIWMTDRLWQSVFFFWERWHFASLAGQSFRVWSSESLSVPNLHNSAICRRWTTSLSIVSSGFCKAELNTKGLCKTLRWGMKCFLSSWMIFAGSFLSAADKLGRESAPMAVHSVAATIFLPSSLLSLDLRSVAITKHSHEFSKSFQFSAISPLTDVGDGSGIW